MSRTAHRLASLDAFRGLTIAGMILVNNPGNWNSVFSPLVHADWNGCTLADLVFPAFLVILGVAIPFAFERRRHVNDGMPYGRIIRRTAALIALGLVLNLAAVWPAVSSIRFPGVLQRIGVVYFAAAFVTLRTRPRQRAAVIVGLLLTHWFLLTTLRFNGRPADLTQSGNVEAAIDNWLFGRHVLTPTGDPEGVLGTVSATATALIGTLFGDMLLTRNRQAGLRLAFRAAAMTVLGLLWAYVLPLNKSLWTGSYALFAAGAAGLGIAVFHVALDDRPMPSWARPLVWLGINPLAIYFGSELLRVWLDRPLRAANGLTPASWLFWSVIRPFVPALFDERFVALAYGVLVIAGWTIVAGSLGRRGVTLRV